MIKIFIPDNNINERQYIVDVIFREFLGLDYLVEFRENTSVWEIELKDRGRIIIEDHFFRKFQRDLEYLNIKNIPHSVKFQDKKNNPFLSECDIPIIYGEDKLAIDENSKTIICGIDIFASSFFMLTRWEEYVNPSRDEYNRFPHTESIAYKFNFLHRPIVNEYVEMLWNMMKYLSFNIYRKKRNFQILLTHDIDIAFKYSSLISGSREILGDILKRKNLILAFENMKTKIMTHLNIIKDPYDTFDYLMDVSERFSTKSYFFLHASTSSVYDFDNSRYLKTLVDKIKSRGHFIGYHPSFNAYKDIEIFRKDKQKIEKIIGIPLKFGRQHWLTFEAPTTWQIWNDCNMEWDSTLYYADEEGFRCGVCYPYSVFNFLTRKKLKLKEKSLTIMEWTLISHKKLNPDEVLNRILYFLEKVKKHNGEFIFLWHNSNLKGPLWSPYFWVYEEVIKYACK